MTVMSNHLAPLVIRLVVKELSQARREHDLAVELLVQSVRSVGILERRINAINEERFRLRDERRRERPLSERAA